MTNYDFAPFWRSSIGFDRLFDLVNSAPRGNEDAFPMYDIERVGDDRYGSRSLLPATVPTMSR